MAASDADTDWDDSLTSRLLGNGHDACFGSFKLHFTLDIFFDHAFAIQRVLPQWKTHLEFWINLNYVYNHKWIWITPFFHFLHLLCSFVIVIFAVKHVNSGRITDLAETQRRRLQWVRMQCGDRWFSHVPPKNINQYFNQHINQSSEIEIALCRWGSTGLAAEVGMGCLHSTHNATSHVQPLFCLLEPGEKNMTHLVMHSVWPLLLQTSLLVEWAQS